MFAAKIRHHQGALIRRQANAVGRRDAHIRRLHLARLGVVKRHLLFRRLGKIQIPFVSYHEIIRPHILRQHGELVRHRINRNQLPRPRPARINLPVRPKLYPADPRHPFEIQYHLALRDDLVQSLFAAQVREIKISLRVRRRCIREFVPERGQSPILARNQHLRERHILRAQHSGQRDPTGKYNSFHCVTPSLHGPPITNARRPATERRRVADCVCSRRTQTCDPNP